MMSVQASNQDQHENQQPLQRSNTNTNTKMKPTGAKHCRYFNTRIGCKNEDTCPFLHIPSDKTVTNKNKPVNRAGEFDCNGEERVTGDHNHIGNTRPGTISNRRSKEIHSRVNVRRNKKEHYPPPTAGEESKPQPQSQSQYSLNPNADDSTASGDDKDASMTANRNRNRNRNRNKNMDCDTNSSADTTTSKRKSQSKKSRNRTKKKGESTRNPDRLTKAQATSALREMISKAQPQHCNENPNQDKYDNNAMCNSNMDAYSNGIGNSIGNGNGNSARGKKSDPKKIRCKYGSKCRANKCKFLHPLDTTNAASSACIKVEQKMNTNSSASHGVSNIDAVQEATSPHTRTRKARRKEKARPATSAGTGPRSNLNADQTSKKSKSHTRKRPQSQPQAQPQPQFTDSNIDQLLFGEGSNELWDNMDIPSLPLPTATAVGSASENGTTRENINGKNNGRADDRSSSQSIGTDTGSRSNSNSRSGAGAVTGTNRSSQNMSSKKIAQRLRKEMQIAERLQQEEKKRIRRMQGQKPVSISINVDVNGSENANGNGNNAIKSQKMMQKVGDNWNDRELVQTRLEEKAKSEAEREKMDAMRKAQGAVAAKKKLDQQKKAAAALAKSIAKAEAEKEKARIAANVRARDKEEMKARAIAKAKADRETEELKRIAARAKVKADDEAKAKALAQAEAEARAMALAEAKASATKAKREEKEKERAKAREIARCKREQEMEARRIEDEMRAEKFAREQAEKANLVVEQKAARAKKLREEKEAARLKKLKNEEKRSNKAMQMKDERLRFWETDRNQRIEFMCVMRQFCFAEAMRIGGINDHSELDSDVLRSIEDEGSKAYATLYPNLAISKIKVITTKNKQLHNRNGTILAWDTSKKKYKIGLDTKKQKVEIVYISAENLEEAESSSSARANKSTTGNVTGSVEAFVKTPLGDLVSSRTFIDRLRLTYRLDPTSLKDSIDKEMKARNEADRVARIRKEKEMKEFLEQQRIADEQFRKEREKRRARQAAEEREHYERARQKEEAREHARRAQRANNRGRSGHFYGGGFGGDFFGSGRGGPNIGFGIGPDGRPFIFLDGEGFDYDDDDSYGWEEEDDGAPMEEHAETLGVPVDASIKEIKTAYRKMALKFHPDKYQAEKAEGMTKDEAEEHFKKCSAAQQHLLEANGD